MRITITSGTGEGPTPTAALDAALIQAGVANYNLLCLSSVIPPGAILTRGKFAAPSGEYGDRLYVVMARHIETREGKAACAGLGWIQDADTGRGLFVELYGDDECEVKKAIHQTLTAMARSRSITFGPAETEIIGITSHGSPVCAVVAAVYQSETWGQRK